MKKLTLETALLARRSDPRALRGALTIVGGKPRIVFGVVGELGRFSVEVNGDNLKLVDDPRPDESAAESDDPEKTASKGDEGSDGGKGSEKGSPVNEAGKNAGKKAGSDESGKAGSDAAKK